MPTSESTPIANDPCTTRGIADVAVYKPQFVKGGGSAFTWIVTLNPKHIATARLPIGVAFVRRMSDNCRTYIGMQIDDCIVVGPLCIPTIDY